MATPRKSIIQSNESGFYHCISRCVRSCYLCGIDYDSNRSYEHRKGWVENRIRELSQQFGIKVMTYAVMSNHIHLVLKIDPADTYSWSAEAVAQRWLHLFPGRGQSGLPIAAARIAEFVMDTDRVEECRQRLGDISWFMRCLNEPIARRANREDGCTGRFWQGRFSSQLLADEGAVLSCMAYVDLNPVRAGVAETPETSQYTGIYERIRAREAANKVGVLSASAIRSKQIKRALHKAQRRMHCDGWMGTFSSREVPSNVGISICVDDYLKLVDHTGRALREDKRGAIAADLIPILERLDLDHKNWLTTVRNYGSLYYRIAGKADRLREAAHDLGQSWVKGVQAARGVFLPTKKAISV